LKKRFLREDFRGVRNGLRHECVLVVVEYVWVKPFQLV
jgi:hypothetical protein